MAGWSALHVEIATSVCFLDLQLSAAPDEKTISARPCNFVIRTLIFRFT